MNHQPRIAVIIVTWNVRDLAAEAVRSVIKEATHTPADVSIWVVDNASTDGTLDAITTTFPSDQYPALHLIDSGANLGFAGGNNLALRHIGYPDGTNLPDYALLLNPDAVLKPGALSALLEGMQSAGAGLGGGNLEYGDGSFQHGCFDLPGLAQLFIDLFPVPGSLYDSRLNGRYPRSFYQSGMPFDVGHPLGACFMLHRDAISDTGLFDEQFHLYCEEIDWAIRIHSAGWRVVCIPSAHVIHHAGQSTNQVRPESFINLWKARLQLYHKHYQALKWMLAIWLVRAGMNRQIQTIARNSAMSDEERSALVNACQQVIHLSRQHFNYEG